MSTTVGHKSHWAELAGGKGIAQSPAYAYEITATESPPSSMAVLPSPTRKHAVPHSAASPTFFSMLFGQGGPDRARMVRP